MDGTVSFTLSYEGNEADENLIDLYDVAHALISFQRSLALTTHLIINGEIITQAPSLKGASILAKPPKEGSWEIIATILAGTYAIGTAPKDTPLGHLVYSIYDYVIQKSLGVKVDYNKSIRDLCIEKRKEDKSFPLIEESKIDSLIEKSTVAIREMHRPIYKTKTADSAKLIAHVGGNSYQLKTKLTMQTYEYIQEITAGEVAEAFQGRITSYNSNTFKGRIYIPEFGRPIAFELNEKTRNDDAYNIITTSLKANATKDYSSPGSMINIIGMKNLTKAEALKSLTVINVSN